MFNVPVMDFSTFRNIIDTNKPYDKGYMMIFGNRYTVSNDLTKATYDVDAVPYITYQEEGTKFFDGNKGFISENTVTELNQVATYKSHGVSQEGVAFEDATRARQSMISQGTLSHVKSHGKQGGSYNDYIGK